LAMRASPRPNATPRGRRPAQGRARKVSPPAVRKRCQPGWLAREKRKRAGCSCFAYV
jgi:hypothetical protein